MLSQTPRKLNAMQNINTVGQVLAYLMPEKNKNVISGFDSAEVINLEYWHFIYLILLSLLFINHSSTFFTLEKYSTLLFLQLYC